MWIKRGIALLLAGLLVLAIALAIGRAPDTYVYLSLSPTAEAEETQSESNAAQSEEGEQGDKAEGEKDRPKDSALKTLLKDLDKRAETLTGVLGAHGATVYQSAASLTDGAQANATAALQGVWGDASLVGYDVLSAGRQLYPGEIDAGAKVAVINEQLAIALYRVGDPLGRTLRIGEGDYRIVGIVKHPRHVGEAEEGLVQVPLLALDEQAYQTTMLSVQLQPKPGAGAYAALQKEMQMWKPGGTLHSLPKEQYRAMLPLRILLCAIGFVLALVALRLCRALARRHRLHIQGELKTTYAKALMPRILGGWLLIILCYALVVGAIALILQALVAPVYLFPEWVPGILVEPKEVAKTFWALRSQESALVQLHTPELYRYQWLHKQMLWACLLFAFLVFSLLRDLWRWAGEQAKRT